MIRALVLTSCGAVIALGCNAISGVDDLAFTADAGRSTGGTTTTTGGPGGASSTGTGGSGGGTSCEPPGCAKLTWDGSCYTSAVYGHGKVTIEKVPSGNGEADVTLEGILYIESVTYGETRHELPPGFFPIKHTPYLCEKQDLLGTGDVSNVPNYEGKGVFVLQPDADHYSNAVLWFPEKKYDGKYTLRCSWQTEEVNPGDLWSSCPGITLSSGP